MSDINMDKLLKMWTDNIPISYIASEFGMSRASLIRRICQLDLPHREYSEVRQKALFMRAEMGGPEKKQIEGRSTICWKCAHACGTCSWSKDFIPISGWTVTSLSESRTYNKQKDDGYIVIKCPQFIEDPKAPYKINPKYMENVNNLRSRIVAEIFCDLKKALRKKKLKWNSMSALEQKNLDADILSLKKLLLTDYISMLSGCDTDYMVYLIKKVEQSEE